MSSIECLQLAEAHVARKVRIAENEITGRSFARQAECVRVRKTVSDLMEVQRTNSEGLCNGSVERGARSLWNVKMSKRQWRLSGSPAHYQQG